MKKLLTVIMTLALALGLISTASAEETHTHCVCGKETAAETTHTHEATTTWTAWNETTSLPSEAGNYYLMGDVTLAETWTVNADINLCLNGKTIIKERTGRAIYVDNKKSLVITDCQTTVGKITHSTGKDGSAIDNNGTLTLWNGSITGNSYGSSGVVINQSGRSFYMHGGSISGNTGSGVSNNGGTFEMSGGVISNNNKGSYGGVYNTGNNAVFNMSGGSITGNSTTQDGGGVYNWASFTMSGGSIAGNSAKSGGGVYNWGAFTISGGSITGNTATANGGGVYNYGTVNLSGDVTITGNMVGSKANNLWKYGDSCAVQIASGSSMGENARVGITARDPANNPMVVSGTTDTKGFFSDDTTYQLVAKSEENALYLEKVTTPTEKSDTETPDAGETDTEPTPTPTPAPEPTPTPTPTPETTPEPTPAPTTGRGTGRSHVVVDTAAADAATAPKTFDAGVGVYAVTAILSATGMAWAGKKH